MLIKYFAELIGDKWVRKQVPKIVGPVRVCDSETGEFLHYRSSRVRGNPLYANPAALIELGVIDDFMKMAEPTKLLCIDRVALVEFERYGDGVLDGQTGLITWPVVPFSQEEIDDIAGGLV